MASRCKRVATTSESQQHVTPCNRSIRKRKCNTTSATNIKSLRLNTSDICDWDDNNDEEQSLSNDASLLQPHYQSSKYANNSSIMFNNSVNANGGENTSITESPKPVYTLRPSVVNGTILYDLGQKPWRLGRPIGKGNFGEIFLASDNVVTPVTNENAKFVVKVEPHSNGPLFVEIHCLMNTARINSDEQKLSNNDGVLHKSNECPSGIPEYIASGSHYFGEARYRFLVLPRFDCDLHSLIKNSRVHQKAVLTLALQILTVLEHLHNKGYCHNDVKAQNLMISKCKYYKQMEPYMEMLNNKNKTSFADIKTECDEDKLQTTDSGNSSEQEANFDYEEFVVKRKAYNDDDEDEDFDDGATTNSNNSTSLDMYKTPEKSRSKRRNRNNVVEFSGSNPVRSCRVQKRTSTYDELVKSHYLRPTKRISYSEFFKEDNVGFTKNDNESNVLSSDNESEEFVPQSIRRSASNKKCRTASKPMTRRQEKMLNKTQASSVTSVNNNVRDNNTELILTEEDRIFLIDYGLASKYMDNGVHRPFVMDQRRAHDGTLEFTSRDAHMGAHSRRSDLECLGYNLLYWSQGYLPWKEAAMQHQQEKVHRTKEYLMTDVREMLKHIYGKQVPKFLGEFLHHVGGLAYNETPNYSLYKRIFIREYEQKNYILTELRLDRDEIARTCVRVKEEIENKYDLLDINKQNNTLSIMKNLSVGTPFQEHNLSNRVSPKNLRSKSDKKANKTKKFSWAEVLSKDPDQIARERAIKEFDRELELMKKPMVRRYKGKPTYAILEIEKLKSNSHINNIAVDAESMEENEDENENDSDKDYEEVMDDNDNDDNDDEDDDEISNKSDNTNKDDEDAEETVADDTETETSDSNTRSRPLRKVRICKKVRISNGSNKKINNGKQRTSNKECIMKVRHAIGIITEQQIPSGKLNQNSSKRGSATRCSRKSTAGSHHTAASAAGEIEHNSKKYYENGQQNGSSTVVENGRLPERRTRRCLLKTEEDIEREESNSSYSGDIHGLFNVWKTINNESMYYKGSSIATRHCKK